MGDGNYDIKFVVGWVIGNVNFGFFFVRFVGVNYFFIGMLCNVVLFLCSVDFLM